MDSLILAIRIKWLLLVKRKHILDILVIIMKVLKRLVWNDLKPAM